MKNIKKLYIITPFKGNNIQRLKLTVDSLKKLKVDFKINHLLIHFKSKIENIEKIKSIGNSEKYTLVTIGTNKPGIYSAINLGLDHLRKDNSYIVLGSGDILKLKKNLITNIKKEEISFINYELSNKKKTKLFRNKYLGMPYCHNAIIFKNNHLRYSTKYKISADYEYFINYIKEKKLNFNNFEKNINYELKMIFESELGISSNSVVKKNFENLQICFKHFGIKGIFLNLIHNIIRLFF